MVDVVGGIVVVKTTLAVSHSSIMQSSQNAVDMCGHSNFGRGRRPSHVILAEQISTAGITNHARIQLLQVIDINIVRDQLPVMIY
jgi:hypothetical protein